MTRRNIPGDLYLQRISQAQTYLLLAVLLKSNTLEYVILIRNTVSVIYDVKSEFLLCDAVWVGRWVPEFCGSILF